MQQDSGRDGRARRLGVAAALVGGRLLPGDVTVAGGRVEAVGVRPAGRDGLAVAGLLDVQVNGYAGVDVAGADADALAALRAALARDGVTGFAPTLITAAPATTTRALGVLAAAPAGAGHPGARVLGAHLEGPFLSPARMGTHPARHRRDPDPAALDALLAAGPVALVTLAPELPGAGELITALVARDVVVMLGHSDATAEQAARGFDLGAAGATHLFNAMPPLHHRAPGLAGAALTRPGAVVTVIADGHHLAPGAVALAFAAAPGRVALVTDATAAAAAPDGEHLIGDVPVTRSGGVVRNAAGGLAGSAATLAGCVRGAVAAGVDPVAALLAATAVPADLLRRPDLGRLRPGAAADVVTLADDLTVRTVLLGGREVA